MNLDHEKNKDLRYKCAFFIFILFGILFFIGIPTFFVFAFQGGFEEGVAGYIKSGMSSIVLTIFFLAFIITSVTKLNKIRLKIAWGIGLILGSLFCIWSIKSFILDIPYLFDYEEVYLSQLKFDFDSNYEYSIFYNVEGYDKNRKFYSFTLNKNTYDLGKEQCDQNRNIRAFIEYLPHTNTVMHIEFR